MGDSAPQAEVSVGVIMGSQSDWPTMAHAVHILEELGTEPPTASSPMRRARRRAG
jgi:phosphoribosylcarboxyaminoimidazole (NCAIR) mutase